MFFDVKRFAALVATAPTVYGIETMVATVAEKQLKVATAPTVYGIETISFF